jgi:hypothetical protein
MWGVNSPGVNGSYPTDIIDAAEIAFGGTRPRRIEPETRMTATASACPSRAGAIFQYFTALTLLVFLVLPNGFLLDIATS